MLDPHKTLFLPFGTGALVVPTGDAHQLGPVEAGGMFPALIAELGAAELCEVMRFDQQWERDASHRLRAGDFSAVAAYDRRGRTKNAKHVPAARPRMSPAKRPLAWPNKTPIPAPSMAPRSLISSSRRDPRA